MGMTTVEKVLARACDRERVAAGDVVEPRVEPGYVARERRPGDQPVPRDIPGYRVGCQGMGCGKKSPSISTIACPLRAPKRPQTRRRYAISSPDTASAAFTTSAVPLRRHLPPDTTGIWLRAPGMVVVGTDSHTTTHGALGAFRFRHRRHRNGLCMGIGASAYVEVPGTIKVVVDGQLPPYVSAKDLILAIIGRTGAEGANYKVLEFHGETIRTLPYLGRLTLCNMAVEAGATAGIVPQDKETLRYLRQEAGVPAEPGSFNPTQTQPTMKCSRSTQRH